MHNIIKHLKCRRNVFEEKLLTHPRNNSHRYSYMNVLSSKCLLYASTLHSSEMYFIPFIVYVVTSVVVGRRVDGL